MEMKKVRNPPLLKKKKKFEGADHVVLSVLFYFCNSWTYTGITTVEREAFKMANNINGNNNNI